MTGALRAEFYKLLRRRWIIPLLIVMMAASYLLLSSDFRSYSFYLSRELAELDELFGFASYSELREWYDTVYARTVFMQTLSDGTPAVFAGLLLSVCFFAFDFHNRAYNCAAYAGVPRVLHILSRLLFVYVFAAVLSLVPPVIVILRYAPGVFSLYSPGYLAGCAFKYLLCALATVSIPVLTVFIAREFFRALAYVSAVTVLGLLLVKSDPLSEGVLHRLMVWHPCIVQKSLTFWDSSAWLQPVLILMTIVFCVTLAGLIYARTELN